MEQKLTLRTDTATYTTADIYSEVEECAALFSQLGYSEFSRNTYVVELSSRMTTTCAYCEEIRPERYKIVVSKCYLQNASSDDVHNTIAHEVCHSGYGCMNHGENWKNLAAKVNNRYKFTKLERCSKDEQYSNFLKEHYAPKYTITCNGCGAVWHYKIKSRIVKGCLRGTCRCACGCKEFTVVENTTNNN